MTARDEARPAAPTSFDGPFRIGELVDDAFEIRAQIGAGGMGVVYDAFDVKLQRTVALKVPHDATFADTLLAEARALAALRHPSLVAVFGLGRHHGIDFMVMERLHGARLDEVIDDERRHGGQLPVAEIIDRLTAISDALTAVHRAGLSHRDVKAANVIVSGERTVLTDFGLVVPELDLGIGPQEQMAGTQDGMAPEVIVGRVRRGLGASVDLYALGALAFELLTLRPPYTGPDRHAILRAHIEAPIPDPRDFRHDVPDEVALLVMELLAKVPEERPESSEVVLWRLAALRDAIGLGRALRMRVLAVDDEASVVHLLKRALETSLPGIEVETSTSAVQARSMIDREQPAAVLVDLNMPGVNGVELCMDLLSRKRGPTVVAMSAQASEDDLALLRSIGVRWFVAKDSSFVAQMSRVVGAIRAGAGKPRPRRTVRPPRRSTAA